MKSPWNSNCKVPLICQSTSQTQSVTDALKITIATCTLLIFSRLHKNVSYMLQYYRNKSNYNTIDTNSDKNIIIIRIDWLTDLYVHAWWLMHACMHVDWRIHESWLMHAYCLMHACMLIDACMLTDACMMIDGCMHVCWLMCACMLIYAC